MEALHSANLQERSEGISDLIETSFKLLSESDNDKEAFGFWYKLFVSIEKKRPKMTALCQFIACRLGLSPLTTQKHTEEQSSSIKLLQSIATVGLARSILDCGIEALLACGPHFDPFSSPIEFPKSSLTTTNSTTKESLLLKATDIAQTVVDLITSSYHEVHLLCSAHIFARLCIMDRLLFFHRRCLLLECHLILLDWNSFFLYYDAIGSCLELSSDLIKSALSIHKDRLFLNVIRAALLLRLHPLPERSINDQEIQFWCQLLDRSLQDHLPGSYQTLCNLLISSPFVHADQNDPLFYSMAKQKLLHSSPISIDQVLVDPFVDHLLKFS